MNFVSSPLLLGHAPLFVIHFTLSVLNKDVPNSLLQDENNGTEERYPAGLLRSNYVVDLMVHPGRLSLKGSYEANRVCGPKCSPPYTAKTLPEVCHCEK